MESSSYEKILGTFLLIAGLAVIVYGIRLGVNVFINAENPPEVFKPVDVSSTPAKSAPKTPGSSLPANLNEMNPADLQKLISGNTFGPEIMASLIPPEMFSYVSRLLNLSVFSIFLWVLITAGAKIAGLGISLIKTTTSVKV